MNDILNNANFIVCVENKARYENLLHQIDKVGLNELPIKIVETSKIKLFSNLYNDIKLSNYCDYINNYYAINCLIEHYRIINHSYITNQQYVTIFEDDIYFINDKNLFYEFFNNIPDDADIIRYGGLSCESHDEIINEYFTNNKYFVELNFGLYGTAGYTLSRNGMKYWLDFVNTLFCCADMPLFYNTNTNINLGLVNYMKNDIKQYISTIPLIYLKYEEFANNQINNTKDTYNFYKNINFDIYNA